MSDTTITQVLPQNVTSHPDQPSVPAGIDPSAGTAFTASKTDDVALSALASQPRNTDRNSFKDYPTFDDIALSRAATNESPTVKAYVNAVNERNKNIDELDKILAYQDSFEATGALPQQAQQFQDYEKRAFNKALHAERTANNLYTNAGNGDKFRAHDVDKLLGTKDGKSPATGESTDAYQNPDLTRDVQDHFISNHVFGANMPSQNADGYYS